jgi:hypothetical protein
VGRGVVERVLKNGRGGMKKAVGNQKGTIVWGIAVLQYVMKSVHLTDADESSDHTIVTSDSLGNVTFWDGASLAQKQSFNAHKADVMCIAIGPVRSSRISLTTQLTSSSLVVRYLPLVQINGSVNSPSYQGPTRRIHPGLKHQANELTPTMLDPFQSSHHTSLYPTLRSTQI